jgi:phage regulator Rha-like protein
MSILPTIENKIIEIRGVPAILDSDVAALYEGETKHVNQAVKNNPDKFPEGYVIFVENEEKSELVKNFDRFNNLKHSTVSVKAFTEQGLYMLATILKSPKATQTTLAIIETFTKMRRLGRSVRELAAVTSDAEKKQLMQKPCEMITDIFADD